MPKRQSVKTHKSDEVQGEGSFVVMTAVKMREVREFRKHADDPDLNEFEVGLALLAKHIVKWNFVDDLGQPLPQPKDDPSVMDELTDKESKFLSNLLMGGEEEAKN